jgi:hypothetical protein
LHTVPAFVIHGRVCFEFDLMAARKATRTSVRSAPGFARWTITLFVFLAFAFQSYVTQTHIHFPHQAAVNIFAAIEKDAPLAKVNTPGKQNPDKYPPADDPDNCPICQEVMHSGQFVMPDFVAMVLPSQPVSIVPLILDLPAIIETVSHAWQGRAPPHR